MRSSRNGSVVWLDPHGQFITVEMAKWFDLAETIDMSCMDAALKLGMQVSKFASFSLFSL